MFAARQRLVGCLSQCRNKATGNNIDISPNFVNRNPRNLERLRIGYKPDGYHLEKAGRCYWHKLLLSETNRFVTATVNHFQNGVVLKASTSEWCIKEQLTNTKDISAYYNLGRVLADRCLMTGLTEIYCNIEARNPNGRIAHFLKALQEGGVTLEEPARFKPAQPWDQQRPEKPWEVTE